MVVSTPSTVVPLAEDESNVNQAQRVHDLGGALGWGRVPYDPQEEPFHEEWERRVFGMIFQVLPHTAVRPGEFRYALERLAEDDYFAPDGYYGRWRSAMEVLLEEYGHFETGELDGRLGAPSGTSASYRVQSPASVDEKDLPPDSSAPVPEHRTVRRELDRNPGFQIGDRVVAPGNTAGGHTRLPDYVRGVSGVVVKIHPAEVLPDSTAHGLGERPQHVVSVAYQARDLWGEGAEEKVVINVDLYENYLQLEAEAQ